MGKKNTKIIPFEKRRNVIQLKDRGKEKKLLFPTLLFGILAVLCLLYCMGIGLFMGYGTYFFLIWGVMGAGFGIISLLCAKPAWRRKIPLFMRRLFWVLFGIGLVVLFLVEGLVMSRCHAEGVPDADYLIVLGARWKPEGPSRVLMYRLDAAVVYLYQNPNTKVIVSGGKGPGEPISEAEGMAGYLIDAGIAKERIFQENTSVNTYENLRNSAAFLDKAKDSVVIVTNNFHVFRSEKLAKGQGYQNATGLAAHSFKPMQVHNLFREFFGVMKDFLMGNMIYWEKDA